MAEYISQPNLALVAFVKGKLIKIMQNKDRYSYAAGAWLEQSLYACGGSRCRLSIDGLEVCC